MLMYVKTETLHIKKIENNQNQNNVCYANCVDCLELCFKTKKKLRTNKHVNYINYVSMIFNMYPRTHTFIHLNASK